MEKQRIDLTEHVICFKLEINFNATHFLINFCFRRAFNKEVPFDSDIFDIVFMSEKYNRII